MRMKLLMAAAMVATLAGPAMADKSDKKTDDPDKPVVKGDHPGELPRLDEVFEVDGYGDFFQQQRVEQEGYNNYSDIDQTTSRQSLASVIQEGRRNGSYISQSDRPDFARSPFSYPSNIAIVDQEGRRNDSYIDQVGSNFKRDYANRADVHQVGSGNYSDVYQAYNDEGLVVVSQGDDGEHVGRVHDNKAYVTQEWVSESEVFVTQTGDRNTAYVTQVYAVDSKVSLQQDSNDNYADIYQTGYDNEIHALQTHGDYNELYITQEGWENIIAVEQRGEGNFADLSQGYDVSNNIIRVLQNGDYNVSYNAQ